MITSTPRRPRMEVHEPTPSAAAPVTLLVRNVPAEISNLQDQIAAAAAVLGYPKASLFALRLAVQEAVSNAFRHGHRNLPTDEPITVGFEVTQDRVRVAVEDHGPGFDPATIPDPTLEPNLEATSGRGLFLIRAYMAEVSYNSRGNRIAMVYARPS
ncbi:MAG: ATP-binding protein [Phycisphaerales bacterium]